MDGGVFATSLVAFVSSNWKMIVVSGLLAGSMIYWVYSYVSGCVSGFLCRVFDAQMSSER